MIFRVLSVSGNNMYIYTCISRWRRRYKGSSGGAKSCLAANFRACSVDREATSPHFCRKCLQYTLLASPSRNMYINNTGPAKVSKHYRMDADEWKVQTTSPRPSKASSEPHSSNRGQSPLRALRTKAINHIGPRSFDQPSKSTVDTPSPTCTVNRV